VGGAGTDTQLWVLAFPFLPSDHQGLDVFDADGTTLWTKRFSPRGLNLNNSVTCRVKPKLTALMQGIELRHADDSAFIDASRSNTIQSRVTYADGARKAPEVLTTFLGVGTSGGIPTSSPSILSLKFKIPRVLAPLDSSFKTSPFA
jgi:hypothetical protein